MPVRWKWITSASVDITNAFAWFPVFVVAHVLAPSGLRRWATGIFLFSLVHQAITPLLLATDRPTRVKHPVVYALGIPVVALGAFALTKAGLMWMAVVAAGWNLVHTLRQRYGIVRLYGRLAGQDRRPLEQGLIFAPFLMGAALLVWLPGRLDRVQMLGFGGINKEIVKGVELIAPAAPWVFLAASGWCSWVMWKLYVAREHRPFSGGKSVYLGSYYLSLLCSLYDPAAGLMALVAAHSFEYFFALDSTLGKRFGAEGTVLYRIITVLRHRRLFLIVSGFACLSLIVLAQKTMTGTLYLLLYMTIGGSHFLFDGFMWKGPKNSGK